MTTVSKAVMEMSNKNLLPGTAKFCGFDVHRVGEVTYRHILNAHTKYVNNTKLTTIEDIHTPDLEKVLHHKH